MLDGLSLEIGVINKGNPRTALENKWMDTVNHAAMNTSWLHDTYGADVDNPEFYHVDHIIGSQAKRKPFGRVGEFAIMPVPIELHEPNDTTHQYHVSKGFKERYGHRTEVFERFVNYIRECGYEIPFSDDVIQAIKR